MYQWDVSPSERIHRCDPSGKFICHDYNGDKSGHP